MRSSPTDQADDTALSDPDALTELRAAQEARSIAEARYLDGHSALFPDAVRTWDEQLGSTEGLADLASRLAELDEVGPAEPMDPDAVPARTAVLLADLVEPTKATALEKLGEGERAMRIATVWLRAKWLPWTGTMGRSCSRRRSSSARRDRLRTPLGAP